MSNKNPPTNKKDRNGNENKHKTEDKNEKKNNYS